jgi:hypothetical protein
MAEHEWFQRNAIDISTSAISIAPAQVISHAWFNSETARLSISNRLRSYCDLCEIQSCCSHQANLHSITTLTGDGDGDYLVRALLSQSVPNNSAYAADGALIILDRDIESTADERYGKLRMTPPLLAPLLIGEVTVKAHIGSTGTQPFGFIFISDAEATIDSSYCIVDLPLTPGTYQVVAFMGEAMFQEFSPRLIGIYGSNFSEALGETLNGLDVNVNENFSGLIDSTNETTVQSRLIPNIDSLAVLNSTLFYDRNALLSDSWAIQRYFEGSEYFQSRMDEFLSQSQYTSFQWIQTADALRIRGKKSESDHVLMRLLGSGLVLTPEENAYLLAVLRAEPGVWPA